MIIFLFLSTMSSINSDQHKFYFVMWSANECRLGQISFFVMLHVHMYKDVCVYRKAYIGRQLSKMVVSVTCVQITL